MTQSVDDRITAARKTAARVDSTRDLVVAMAKSALADSDVPLASLDLLAQQCRQIGAHKEAALLFQRVSESDPAATEARTLRDIFSGNDLIDYQQEKGPSAFVQVENFLSWDLYCSLRDRVLEDVKHFHEAKVFDPNGSKLVNTEARKGRVLDKGKMVPYREAFLPKIESEVEKHRIFNRLGLVEFSKKRFELQVTNYSDGEYFGRHTDNSLSQTQNRKISFVYYLRRQRDCYSGGELVLYDWRSRSSKLAAKSHTRILPYENSIVFFVSSDVHEVLPTFVESGCREDGRFSINGWIVNDSGRVQ